MTQVVSRTDSDGYEHQICAQSHMNSCAMASLFMLECIKKSMSMDGGEERLWYLSGQFAGHFSGVDGTLWDNVVRVLAKLQINPAGWDETDVENEGTGQTIRPSYIGMQRPALVGIGWWGVGPKGWTRFGGHMVLARWMTDDRGKVVFLDPYKGQLVERVNDGSFRSRSGSGLIETVMYT